MLQAEMVKCNVGLTTIFSIQVNVGCRFRLGLRSAWLVSVWVCCRWWCVCCWLLLLSFLLLVLLLSLVFGLLFTVVVMHVGLHLHLVRFLVFFFSPSATAAQQGLLGTRAEPRRRANGGSHRRHRPRRAGLRENRPRVSGKPGHQASTLEGSHGRPGAAAEHQIAGIG